MPAICQNRSDDLHTCMPVSFFFLDRLRYMLIQYSVTFLINELCQTYVILFLSLLYNITVRLV